MYTSFHAATGGAIAYATGDPVIGSLGAFLSHFLFDYIGEAGYGSLKRTIAIEIPLWIVLGLSAYMLDGGGLFLLGAFMGNLPDFIDKPRRIIFGKKEWFSCHNGSGLFSCGSWKFGYPVFIPLTKQETLWANVASVAAIFIASLISYFL